MKTKPSLLPPWLLPRSAAALAREIGGVIWPTRSASTEIPELNGGGIRTKAIFQGLCGRVVPGDPSKERPRWFLPTRPNRSASRSAWPR